MGLANARQVWVTYNTSKCNYTQPTQHHKKQKHQHHDLPCPLASSGFNFIGECDRRMLRNRSWSLQHGDVIFIDETNIFFILLTNILKALDQRARKLKVSYFSDYLFFFLTVALKRCALTPAICWYFFANVLLVLVMFCHDFVLGGGGAMVAMFTLLLHR
jgi:hypothetical protein